jgi:hypothetical protein
VLPIVWRALEGSGRKAEALAESKKAIEIDPAHAYYHALASTTPQQPDEDAPWTSTRPYSTRTPATWPRIHDSPVKAGRGGVRREEEEYMYILDRTPRNGLAAKNPGVLLAGWGEGWTWTRRSSSPRSHRDRLPRHRGWRNPGLRLSEEGHARGCAGPVESAWRRSRRTHLLYLKAMACGHETHRRGAGRAGQGDQGGRPVPERKPARPCDKSCSQGRGAK